MLASIHPSKPITGQAARPQHTGHTSAACGLKHAGLQSTRTSDISLGHGRLKQMSQQTPCKWPRAHSRSGPTLAAGWGVFSFLAASFLAALGLSSLAASFFSGFFSAACMPRRMMSEPSSQQQGPLCQARHRDHCHRSKGRQTSAERPSSAVDLWQGWTQCCQDRVGIHTAAHAPARVHLALGGFSRLCLIYRGCR